jgi:hypothetical protein
MIRKIRAVKYEELIGKKVKVYRNLHNGMFSVWHKGIVIAHISEIYLKDVRLHVSECGRLRVLEEKRKNVHAYAIGTVCESSNIKGELIRYNPYQHTAAETGSFVCKDTNRRVLTAAAVRMKIGKCLDGQTKAEMLAMLAK